MYQKIAIVGGTAAVIIGLGTAAFAESGSTSGTPSPTPTSSASAGSTAGSTAGKTAGKGGALGHLSKRLVHGQVVTKGKGGTFVTHDFAKGTVTSVSATSIVVKSADNSSETFVVNSATKVRVRTSGHAAAGTIAQVKTGEVVLVVGTGTGPFTATQIGAVQK